MTTRRDFMYAVQKSYSHYGDDELYKMILTGHLSRYISREVNEGFYAAEELIERLQKKLEKVLKKNLENADI